MNSAELIRHLAGDYRPPSFAFLPEFRCATGYARDTRADAIAMSLWPSATNGLEIIGFELKVSRSDWLRELKSRGTKSQPVKQFCDRWYLVAGSASVVKDMDEIPEDWGFIFPVAPGHPENASKTEMKLITYKEAPLLTSSPCDRAFIGAIMRRATRVDGLAHIVPPNNDYKSSA